MRLPVTTLKKRVQFNTLRSIFACVLTFNIIYYAVASCVGSSKLLFLGAQAIPWNEINFRITNRVQLDAPVAGTRGASKVTDSWNDTLG